MNRHDILAEATQEVFDCFIDQEINCWLIHGAFLGLYRNNQLLDWDSDIDLGMWISDVDSIDSGWLESKGFEVGEQTYRGLKTNYYFSKYVQVGDNKKRLSFSVMAYSPGEEYAWIPIRKRRSLPRNLLKKTWRRCTNFLFRFLKNHTFLKPSPDFFLWKKNYLLGTRKVPMKYFSNLEKYSFGGLSFYAPADAEGYLEYLYGDWWVTKKEWDNLKDDGSFYFENPEDCGWQLKNW